jgi:hypothetical protein
MTATGHITPSDLRPPAWPDLATVAEQVLADLRTSPRATPPKLLAAQVVARHVLHSEALPSIAVDALGCAMSLNRTVARRPWASVDEAVEQARLAASAIPVPRKQRAVILDAVRYISEKEYVLYGSIFDSVVRALGLTDADGRLRQQVRESIMPSGSETVLAGVVIDGRAYGPRDPLPEQGDDVQFVFRPLKEQPHHGIRHREAMWDKAVSIEAAARTERGTHAGTRALPYKELARKLVAAGFKNEEADLDLLKRWGRSRPWKTAVLLAAVYPIWNAPKRATHTADPTPPRRP